MTIYIYIGRINEIYILLLTIYTHTEAANTDFRNLSTVSISLLEQIAVSIDTEMLLLKRYCTV